MLKCQQLLAFSYLGTGKSSYSAELSMKMFYNFGARTDNNYKLYSAKMTNGCTFRGSNSSFSFVPPFSKGEVILLKGRIRSTRNKLSPWRVASLSGEANRKSRKSFPL